MPGAAQKYLLKFETNGLSIQCPICLMGYLCLYLISNHVTGIPSLRVVCRKACSQFEAGVVRTPPYVPCAFLSACLPACLQPLCSYASDLVQRGRGGSREGASSLSSMHVFLLPSLMAVPPSFPPPPASGRGPAAAAGLFAEERLERVREGS